MPDCSNYSLGAGFVYTPKPHWIFYPFYSVLAVLGLTINSVVSVTVLTKKITRERKTAVLLIRILLSIQTLLCALLLANLALIYTVFEVLHLSVLPKWYLSSTSILFLRDILIGVEFLTLSFCSADRLLAVRWPLWSRWNPRSMMVGYSTMGSIYVTTESVFTVYGVLRRCTNVYSLLHLVMNVYKAAVSCTLTAIMLGIYFYLFLHLRVKGAVQLAAQQSLRLVHVLCAQSCIQMLSFLPLLLNNTGLVPGLDYSWFTLIYINSIFSGSLNLLLNQDMRREVSQKLKNCRNNRTEPIITTHRSSRT